MLSSSNTGPPVPGPTKSGSPERTNGLEVRDEIVTETSNIPRSYVFYKTETGSMTNKEKWFIRKK